MPKPSPPSAASRLERLCERVVEAGWLVAVTAVPLAFTVDGARAFELPKTAVLRSVAIVMALALAIRALERRRRSLGLPAPVDDRSRAARPALLAAVVFLGLQLLSASGSIAPRDSWIGSFSRTAGVSAAAACLVVFLSVLTLLRTREQWGRLASAIVVTCLATSLYAITQRLGGDPFPSGAGVTGRPFSTVGNAIGLAATTALGLAVAVERLWETMRRAPRPAVGPALLYAGAVIVEMVALAASGSLGPLLGLLASGALAVPCLAVVAGRHRLAAALLVVTLLVAGSGAALLVGSRLRGTRLGFHGRGARTSASAVASKRATAQVRLLLWQVVADTLASEPRRLVFGRGPDTQRLALAPHVTPELARAEATSALPDRSHNQLFDVALESGAAGCLAYLGFFAVLFALGARRLGLLAAGPQTIAFLCTLGGAAAIAVLVARGLDHSWRFAGVAAPVGMGGALFAFLAARCLAAARSRDAARPRPPVAVALLLGAVFGHLAETQVAFGVPSTLLLLWVFAGALLVLPDADGSPLEPAAEPAAPHDARSPPLGGLLTGLVIAFFVFNAGSPRVAALGALLPALGAVLWLLSLGVWSGLSRTVQAARPHAAAAAAVVVAEIVLRGIIRAPGGAGSPAALLVVIGSVLGAAAWILGRGQKRGAPVARGPVPGYLVLAAVAAAVIARGDLSRLSADTARGEATRLERQGRLDASIELGRQAVEIDPGEAIHRLLLGRSLARLAPNVRAEAERLALYEKASSELTNASKLAPLDPEVAAEHALLYEAWASDDRRRREDLVATALPLFDRALALRPGFPPLYTNRCAVHLMRNDAGAAEADCRRALALDRRDRHAMLLLGQICEATNRPAEALEWYRVIQASPDAGPDARALLARLLRRLGRQDEARRMESRP